MNAPRKLKFIANARLKDIVGRGLINNDNIAIIELIKNSKDAGSSSVSIDFYQSDAIDGAAQLYICDHGRGMSVEDIEFKWLNIAYSEKKHTAPTGGGAYAGNKGIGRFSCDRLGRKLNVYTRKKGGRYVTLRINWQDYEVDDQRTEIGSIETEVRNLTPSEFEAETGLDRFEHGTVLVISDLRANWTKDKLRTLRRELERFVIDPNRQFDVSLSHWKYDEKDEINQPIENKIFSDLDFRATSVSASIDDEGRFIDIELRHDGDFIFKSREANQYNELKSVFAKFYFLNQPAKAFFKRRTGYRSVKYGSIFLFLNGFRVFPYGSEGDDWLGFDRRRQQGHSRFFGTRDLVGFIQIKDTSGNFHPVSSREGVVNNLAFQQLTSASQDIEIFRGSSPVYGFVHKLTRKLEQFVVEGLDWDRIARSESIEESDLLSGKFEFLKTEKRVLETIDSVIQIRSPREYIEHVEINLKYLSEIAEQETDDYRQLVQSLGQKFEGRPIEKLRPIEKKDLSKFISRTARELKAKNRTNAQLEKGKEKVEKRLRVEQKRRLFAETHSTRDHDTVLQLHHQINLIADGIWKRLNGVSRRYRKDSSNYSKDALIEVIEAGRYEIEKIRNAAKLALKADFDLMTNKVNTDVIQFIGEYLDNYRDILSSMSLTASLENPTNIRLTKSFRPIEMTMLVDNLLVNAGKSKASQMKVVIRKREDKTYISFIDNGGGLSNKYDPEDFFEKGISTTSGSGIGLSHIRQIVSDLNGRVTIKNNDAGGVSVELEFVS